MAKYDLYYLNMRARAELARLVFAAAGVEYNDHRTEYADFEKLKAQSPLGAAPWLEVDGVKLPQSIALARFLAREFKLDGTTSMEKAQADVLIDTGLDLVNAIGPIVFKMADGPEKEEKIKNWFATDAIKGFSNIEKLIGWYGKDGFSVGSALTWSDLGLFELHFSIGSKIPDFAKHFPLTHAVVEKVANNERVKAYVASRPVTAH